MGEHPFVRKPGFTEAQARAAIAEADCWSTALRILKLRTAGGNHRTLQKWARIWDISTDHFDPKAVRARSRPFARSLDEVLVENSSYHRGKLKDRLYAAGLKARKCELCGQDESWRGRKMALILDHINGIANDHRLENLQIVCPNCAATLETHCGRNLPKRTGRNCEHCSREFVPNYSAQRFCCLSCGCRSPRCKSPKLHLRKAERPPYEQLMDEIAATNWSAVGRKYGVSDNAIRKCVRAYRRELGLEGA